MACHIPPLAVVYWATGWYASGHAAADVIYLYIVGVAYALYRLYRLRLAPAQLFWWTGGLLIAAPLALPALYWTYLVKADR